MSEGLLISRDYFISRTDADKGIALTIAAVIRQESDGAKTWLQDEDFGPASFLERMEQGFESGARMLALLSAAYQKSDFCKKEYHAALAQDPLNRNGRLIVMRVGPCAPTGLLRDLAYIDLVPILAMADAGEREVLFRQAIRIAIGLEKPSADFAKLYRHVPQIVHRDIDAVPGFTGRDAELEALGGALFNGGRAALTNSKSAAATLKGLGGVGKTVLAREYAWRERAQYHGVWWVRAETREAMLEDLIELGARFIPGLQEVADRELAVRAAIDFLESTPTPKPWLIVYDNAENPDALEKLVPRMNAHVLITTRWADWYGHAQEISVGVFSRETAITFLLNQARGAAERPQETQDSAAKLAEDLGDLPLALAIARAHAWAMNWSLEDYRGHLGQMIERSPTKAVDYPRSLLATFTLAIEKAKTTKPEAERLLNIAAFLAPARIPLSLITEDVMSALEKGEAVAALSEVSLVACETLDDGAAAISVHRLVQEVVRKRMAGDVGEVAALATRLVADAYPNDADDVRNWPACRRLEEHAASVLAFAPEAGETAEKTSLLLNQHAVHLIARADYAEAEPLMRRALKIDEASFGAEHPDVARDLNNLAQLLKATNRLAEAEPLMRRALKIDEASFGAEHPDVATDLNNLAQLLKATNRLAEAEPLMRRALKIDEASFGAEHPNVGIRLNNLAQLLADTNRLSEAEPLMRRALKIDEASFGAEHPNVGIRLNNLALLLKATNRLSEAEPLMRRALKIDEASFGAEHPKVGIRLNNLAQLLADTNRLSEAEPLMRRALKIDEASFGAEHPDVARDLNNLAQLLADTNRLAEAEPLMRRALAIFANSLGNEHPSTLTVRANYHGLMQQFGNEDETPAAAAPAEKKRGWWPFGRRS